MFTDPLNTLQLKNNTNKESTSKLKSHFDNAYVTFRGKKAKCKHIKKHIQQGIMKNRAAGAENKAE